MKSRKPSRKEFAKRLLKLMWRRGISFCQLAKAADVYLSTLYGYTGGKNFPTYITEERLADALGVTLDELHGRGVNDHGR